jgi:uncharacterized membrane protein YphA (DoxX/SURF4 family)
MRLGLGTSLVAAGLGEKLLDAGRAFATVDKYNLTGVVPVSPVLWVVAVGLTETALGLALIAGAWTRVVAVLAFGVLTMTLFGLPDDPVLAHVTLFGACSVLVVTGSGRWSFDALVRARVGRRLAAGSAVTV